MFERTPDSLIKAFACPVCVAHACLERLHAAAREAQIECLDDQWRGYAARYQFRCEQGHSWLRRPSHVYAKASCPICVRQENHRSKQLPDGLARLRQVAQSRGGECLSNRYEGYIQRYRFRCAAGHEWLATGGDILNKGHWCRICAYRVKVEGYRLADGLKRLQTMAEKRGGRCLATAYVGVAARYHFCCGAGHEWQATGKRILRGSWCPHCELASRGNGKRRRRDGLSRLQATAQQQGGECLSTEYHGTAGRYEFRCQQGHEWQAFGASILKGTWCRQCAHEARRLGLEKAQQVARDRGGECLSKRYVNNSSKLQWLCHRGHTWQVGMNSIQAGHWCPTCAHQSQITSRASKAWKRYLKAEKTVGHLPGAMMKKTP